MRFKFLEKNISKPTFQFEISNYIHRAPESRMCWASEYSDLMRRWMSDLFFSNDWTDPSQYFKYFSSIDRTCEIMERPNLEVAGAENSICFNVKIKIWATDRDWLIIHLSYPTEHIIYR
jgi:hypothetical protein